MSPSLRHVTIRPNSESGCSQGVNGRLRCRSLPQTAAAGIERSTESAKRNAHLLLQAVNRSPTGLKLDASIASLITEGGVVISGFTMSSRLSLVAVLLLAVLGSAQADSGSTDLWSRVCASMPRVPTRAQLAQLSAGTD